MEHPTLSFPLLAHIRLLVAHEENYPYCINLNQGLLQTLGGLKEEQIAATKADPDKAALEPKDKAMLLFVLKAVQDPATTEKEDVDALHDLGWTDRDIFDAVTHGMNMVSAGMMFKAFKMGES
ncbi:carboxymuconolactone decarboxylase family protein [Thermodesulfobacteriota bacterium]